MLNPRAKAQKKQKRAEEAQRRKFEAAICKALKIPAQDLDTMTPERRLNIYEQYLSRLLEIKQELKPYPRPDFDRVRWGIRWVTGEIQKIKIEQAKLEAYRPRG